MTSLKDLYGEWRKVVNVNGGGVEGGVVDGKQRKKWNERMRKIQDFNDKEEILSD